MTANWSEEAFSAAFREVLDYYDIEYEAEKKVPSTDTDTRGTGRRMDIYIPKTDTAIELKGREGDLHAGIGRALNYTRSCKEAVLILDGEAREAYRSDIHKTCRIAPAVHFAMVIPNTNLRASGSGAGFDIRTDSRPDLFFEMLYNAEWNDDMAVIDQLTPEYLEPGERRFNRPTGEHNLNEFIDKKTESEETGFEWLDGVENE